MVWGSVLQLQAVKTTTEINMFFIVFSAGIFCGISIDCAASRATRAFAQDKSLPFHEISPRTGVPLIFNAFVDATVMCLGASNAIPIAERYCRQSFFLGKSQPETVSL
ncbi:hypothetical protein L218DRAFT_764108 [Marasmius fiardii PR-910]|nr:hypothetical protein L218DRAFT_764108 [Marasmius fiardii PR-910]